jgi:hypothetical protein
MLKHKSQEPNARTALCGSRVRHHPLHRTVTPPPHRTTTPLHRTARAKISTLYTTALKFPGQLLALQIQRHQGMYSFSTTQILGRRREEGERANQVGKQAGENGYFCRHTHHNSLPSKRSTHAEHTHRRCKAVPEQMNTPQRSASFVKKGVHTGHAVRATARYIQQREEPATDIQCRSRKCNAESCSALGQEKFESIL